MAQEHHDLVFSVALSHLVDANEATKRAFIERYKQSLFPNLGTSSGQTIWKTYRNITRITLWGRDHFRNNIRLAMAAEALGLGPDTYCMERNNCRGLSERIFLLMWFLPPHKLCFDSIFGLDLNGPFNRFPRAGQDGTNMASRLLPLNVRPNMCPVCHTFLCDHAMEELVDI